MTRVELWAALCCVVIATTLVVCTCICWRAVLALLLFRVSNGAVKYSILYCKKELALRLLHQGWQGFDLKT